MYEEQKGLLAICVACVIWGLSALYYYAIRDIPPLEILSHRTIWSFVFVFIILGVCGKITLLPRAMILPVAIAAILISLNWLGFIFSTQLGLVRQSSLGYYIFPLFAVFLGAVFLGEKLRKAQWWAVGIVCIAVLILSIGNGSIPWMAIFLAITFALYNFIKKPFSMAPMESVMWEVALLLPIALLWLYGVHYLDWQGLSNRTGGFWGRDLTTNLMLMLSGILTGGPLVLLAYAMKKIRFATIGLIQYLNPTLQFFVAIYVLMEPLSAIHMVSLVFIWIALGIYSYDNLRKK